MKTQKQIDIKSYKADGFIEKYQELIRTTVIPYQYNVLCDRADGAEKSHVMQNFINAGKPDEAERLYEFFVQECKKLVPNVQKGVFGADMKVELLNDGPFTVVLEDI